MSEINQTKYIPILAVRPAEMNALKELPDRDKDLLLPAIQFRPWVGSHNFENTTKKVEEVFGKDRKLIANLDCDYTPSEPGIDPMTGNSKVSRSAIMEFNELCNSKNGYSNWCKFIEENKKFIPSIQLKDKNQFNDQVICLAALKRGLVIHLTALDQMLDGNELSLLQAQSKDNQILFIIDYGELGYRQELNTTIATWIDSFNKMSQEIPSCKIAISSTSFPNDFSNGIEKSEIRERQLYNLAVATNQDQSWNLVYSDRGSARQQTKRSGGGVPYPRIDYPTNDTWYFYRSENQDGEYQGVAQKTIKGKNWNPKLRLWGTEMIVSTAEGEKYAITSPVKATAVRINIHLHQQLLYDSPDHLLDTDDDWVD